VIDRSELRHLRNRIEEARLALNSIPDRQALRIQELLKSALTQADAMLAKPTASELLARGRAKLTLKRNS